MVAAPGLCLPLPPLRQPWRHLQRKARRTPSLQWRPSLSLSRRLPVRLGAGQAAA